jgi:hypothetical protein
MTEETCKEQAKNLYYYMGNDETIKYKHIKISSVNLNIFFPLSELVSVNKLNKGCQLRNVKRIYLYLF